jgi:RNA polymerase sigma factor (sigma-70 family)
MDDTFHSLNGRTRAQVVPAGPPAGPAAGPAALTQEVVAAAQAGDHAAFEAIYAHYAARLRDYLAGIVGHADGDEAEDLLQDTWLRAWIALPQTRFAAPGALTAWLYTIAHHVAIDRLRRRKGHGRAAWPRRFWQLQWDHLGPTDARRLGEVSAHEEPGYVAVLDASEELVAAVRAALEGLPAPWRVALVRQLVHHERMATIATTMSTPGHPVSVAGVKRYLYRARQRLRAVAVSLAAPADVPHQTAAPAARRSEVPT